MPTLALLPVIFHADSGTPAVDVHANSGTPAGYFPCRTLALLAVVTLALLLWLLTLALLLGVADSDTRAGGCCLWHFCWWI